MLCTSTCTEHLQLLKNLYFVLSWTQKKGSNKVFRRNEPIKKHLSSSSSEVRLMIGGHQVHEQRHIVRSATGSPEGGGCETSRDVFSARQRQQVSFWHLPWRISCPASLLYTPSLLPLKEKEREGNTRHPQNKVFLQYATNKSVLLQQKSWGVISGIQSSSSKQPVYFLHAIHNEALLVESSVQKMGNRVRKYLTFMERGWHFIMRREQRDDRKWGETGYIHTYTYFPLKTEFFLKQLLLCVNLKRPTCCWSLYSASHMRGCVSHKNIGMWASQNVLWLLTGPHICRNTVLSEA